MEDLAPCDDLFSLEDLAAEIRSSSNFRFAWQFYSYGGDGGPIFAHHVRRALEVIAGRPDCYRFLQESFDPMYREETFCIERPHEHCRIQGAAGEFENILAMAAGDHLGAYSPELRECDSRRARTRDVPILSARLVLLLHVDSRRGARL